jgi:hypothetical protein
MKKLLINVILMSLISFFMPVLAMETETQEINLPRFYLNNKEITINTMFNNATIYLSSSKPKDVNLRIAIKPVANSTAKKTFITLSYTKDYVENKRIIEKIIDFYPDTLGIFITTAIQIPPYINLSSLKIEILTKEMVEKQLGKDAASHFSKLPREIREEVYKFYKLTQ